MDETKNQQLQELYKAALFVMENAYVPYSDHPVAAAIRAADGQIYTGVNVEVANYKSICAEGTAITDMVKNGAQEIVDLVVIGPGEHLCTPCGDCRQRIREFAVPQTRIYVMNKRGDVLKTYDMEGLLPDSFGPENLS